MAASSSRKASADKPTPAAADEAPKAAVSPAEETADENGRSEYTDKALALAGDVRDYVDKTRADLKTLLARVDDDVQQTERTVAEYAAAEGVRRIPMAADDVLRTLDGLAAAATELQNRATA